MASCYIASFHVLTYYCPTKYSWGYTNRKFVQKLSDDRLLLQALKQEGLGSIPGGYRGFFHFQLAYTNVDGMKDLWCSSTVWLLSTQT